ncbi:MAG: NADH-quinone oxidoreductase subunit J [Helicobacteraceae bacterium]|jgi:NADH-quinone oxidoreductase subunit J|nr:NADH-quinone oxidoreductase subunit J [Helicobacteraceae bacterium]
MFETIAFYLFAALVIGCFTITVMSRQIVYSFSALAAGMIFISAFFFLLDADFMGVVQIVVYTGAVVALYAFGMMFFDASKPVYEEIAAERLVFVLSAFTALVAALMIAAPSVLIEGGGIAGENNVKTLGVALFTEYLLPFELSGLLLLTAMIAGILLASRKMEYTHSEERKK